MPTNLKIKKLKFYAGSKKGGTPLEIDPGSIVVFVGPNNSGKSMSLKEIEDWCFSDDKARKVVSDIEISFPTDPNEAESLVRKFKSTPPENESELPDKIWVSYHTFRQDMATRTYQVDIPQLRGAVTNQDIKYLRTFISSNYTARLIGRTRFTLVDPKPAGDLLKQPENHISALFQNDNARNKVRSLVLEAFGQYFVIDPTDSGRLRIRLSDRQPRSTTEEQALNARARAFHKRAKLIGEFSDGVQAFTGLVSAVLSLPHQIILIDEPEAFLYPPLARRLGSNLSEIAEERNASLLVATHSSEFLIGCLESSSSATIIRLTYDGEGTATARALPTSTLEEMIKDPLIRSTGALRSLFHRAVIVTESEADRAFYDEINRRLVNEDRGIKDALFIQAQNKQTICRIIGPLRKIGVPAAAVLDLDILKNGTTDWNNLFDAANVSPKTRTSLFAEISIIISVFQRMSQNNAIKKGGLSILSTTDKKRAQRLLNKLAKYGIFLVPNGELETWLSSLNARSHGSKWLIAMFSKIGQTSSSSNYLTPASNDIWLFLDNISDWIVKPNKLGI